MHESIRTNSTKGDDRARDMEINGLVNQKDLELALVVMRVCMDGHEITIECTIEMKPGLVPL